MQYSDSYKEAFIAARVCVREEIMSKYSMISTLMKIGSCITLYTIEDAADLLTTYNELIDSDLFFRMRDFEN